MKKFTSWEEVFESFTNEEKTELRSQVADTCGRRVLATKKFGLMWRTILMSMLMAPQIAMAMRYPTP